MKILALQPFGDAGFRLLVVAALVLGSVPAAGQEGLADAVGRLWLERDPEIRAAALQELAQLPFRPVFEALAAGPRYPPRPGGQVRHATQRLDGIEYAFSVVIPDGYRAEEPTPVRVMLHGGVSTDDRRRGSRGALENLQRGAAVTILPSAWRDRPWWHPDQVRSVARIVREIRREYNLDENRTHVAGISDGGTGAYFVAMKDPTPWSAFLSLIGHPAVLRSVTQEPLFAVNLRARPFFVVNTGNDRLYPHSEVLPYLETLRAGGVTVEYHPEMDYGHDTNWWPRQRENMAAFLAAHPREPHPPSLEWATDGSGFDRLHWLRVLEVGEVGNESELDDWNTHLGRPLFPRTVAPARVRAERGDNAIALETAGVRRLELLLSPTVFDFSREIRITANGVAVFSGRVEPSVATLLRWHAHDLDRTMLYGAALEVDLAAGRVSSGAAPPTENEGF